MPSSIQFPICIPEVWSGLGIYCYSFVRSEEKTCDVRDTHIQSVIKWYRFFGLLVVTLGNLSSIRGHNFNSD